MDGAMGEGGSCEVELIFGCNLFNLPTRRQMHRETLSDEMGASLPLRSIHFWAKYGVIMSQYAKYEQRFRENPPPFAKNVFKLCSW